MAVAAGLVRVNGALVPRPSEGIRWVHLGSHTATVAKGDTLRYVAASNGRDTLIATSDFCLAGAKCADTVIARVSQTLTLGLSTHALRAWSFSDSLSPDVTLADKRGFGLAGTSIRFVPVSAADSVIVRVGPVVGAGNPGTGVMATPRLISTGNGTATVTVQALAPDGTTILASDVVSETVRQVANRANVEALRALMSATDSIPVKAVARDARGADHRRCHGQRRIQYRRHIPRSVGRTERDRQRRRGGRAHADDHRHDASGQQPARAADSGGHQPLEHHGAEGGHREGRSNADDGFDHGVRLDRAAGAGAPIVFYTSLGTLPATAVTDINGQAVVVWTPPDSAGYYTLTGIRPASGALTTLADSTGRIVVRRSIRVIADPTQSTVEVTAASIAANGTTTVTVKVRDVFGNLLKTAMPNDLTVTITRGAVGAFSCSLGVCTATYTAPATGGG